MYFHFGTQSRSLSILPTLQTRQNKQNSREIISKDSVSTLLNPETTKEKEKSTSLLNKQTSEQNIGGIGNNLMKNTLNHSYSKQINEKTNEELLNKRLKIMQQRDYLSNFQKHIDFQNRRNRHQKYEYRNQLLSQIKNKKQIIESVKTEEVELERMYQQPRELSLKHKSRAYRDFYEQSKKYQREVEKQYIDYMKVEQLYEKHKNKDKISNYEYNLNTLNRHLEQQSKLTNMKRQSLKRMLEQQMKLNESRTRVSLGINREIKAKQKYSTKANPINLKIDLNKKNVLNQLSNLN